MNARTWWALFAMTAFSVDEKQSATDRIKGKTRMPSRPTRSRQSAPSIPSRRRRARLGRRRKRYLSDDPETCWRGAEQKLNELGAEITELRKRNAGLDERIYFLTRLEALEQHHQYAATQLASLAPDEVRKHPERLRKRVDTTLARLEDCIDLAQREAKHFSSTA